MRRRPATPKTRVVAAKRVAVVAECVAIWLPADAERWRLVRIDLYGFAPAGSYKLAWYCRDCAEREFADGNP